MWDPRNGKKTAKLVGYTDILMRDDARYVTAPLGVLGGLIWAAVGQLLTGSADGAYLYIKIHNNQNIIDILQSASIKFWSLSSQRRLHTFTYHTVIILHSPCLKIFHLGDKTNLVCKVDVEGCADVS